MFLFGNKVFTHGKNNIEFYSRSNSPFMMDKRDALASRATSLVSGSKSLNVVYSTVVRYNLVIYCPALFHWIFPQPNAYERLTNMGT